MIDRSADWHTHSDLTDGADSWESMAAAAVGVGLQTLGASDHVRRSSTWVNAYVDRVRALDGVDGLRMSVGVEAKILDGAGRLDLPDSLPPLDHLLVADHQFPGAAGPEHPRDVATRIAGSARAASDTLDQLVSATCAAVTPAPAPVVLAHLFSLLPKLGLSEDLVTDEHLHALATACTGADAAVEINEKWRCPSPRVAAGLHARGVRLVAGSDAHRAADVGRWEYLDAVEHALGVLR